MWRETPAIAKDKPLLLCIHPALPTTALSRVQPILVDLLQHPIHIRTPTTPAPTRIPRSGVRRSTNRAHLVLHALLREHRHLVISSTRTLHPSTTLLRPIPTRTPQQRSRDLTKEGRIRLSLILDHNRRQRANPSRHPCLLPRTLRNQPAKRRCIRDHTPWTRRAQRLPTTVYLRGIPDRLPFPNQPPRCRSVMPIKRPRPALLSTSLKSTSQWPWNRHHPSAVHRACAVCVTTEICGRMSTHSLLDGE